MAVQADCPCRRWDPGKTLDLIVPRRLETRVMCGIHAAICNDAAPPELTSSLQRRLRNRGPDHIGRAEARLGAKTLSLISTVLALRGDDVTRQPLVDDGTGSVLCWNGEAWKLGGEAVEGNDGQAVFSVLVAASRGGGGDGVVDALRSVQGPFAFVYLDRPGGRLYYGRDRLGRRSLLVKREAHVVLLSSVAGEPTAGWVEVEADGCYVLQLDEAESVRDLSAVRHDWGASRSLVSGVGLFNAATPVRAPPLTRASPSVSQLRDRLCEATRRRLRDVPIPPDACASDARTAILFSGGLDCTVLARMAHDMLPTERVIDLLNVAFENPRITAQHPQLTREELYEQCPDRVTARRSLAELTAACPPRRWRLVTIDVPYALAQSHRAEVVQLMHPHNTEMDLSIAFALYFAARGVGQAAGSEAEAYGTPARVLLSGLGADELFGGYVRHATAFRRDGYRGLVEELRLDVGRLGKRNLGRDDRVMAHWGREVRYPYLDEDVVRWAVELPVWEKCGFDDGDGLDPGKRVLRLLAAELGMAGVAEERKRAVQFGARTAKMQSGKVRGTTIVEA